MKKYMGYKIICVFLLVLITSCSIQKRHFTDGYDVQWRKTYASSSDELFESENKSGVPCDTLIGKNGSTTLASVERIDSKKIYVKPCENSNENITEFERSEVSVIHYANGAVFENKTPEQLQKERKEHLEQYRLEQARIVKEDTLKQDQKKNSETEKAQVQKPKKQQKDKISTRELLLIIFFVLAFSLIFITLFLGGAGYDGFFACLLMILFLFGLVTLFITVVTNAILRLKSHDKCKLKLILTEVIFSILALGDILAWFSKLSLF